MENHDLGARFLLATKKYVEDDTSRFIGRHAVRAIIWDKTSGRCWYCGKTMNPFSEFCIDHVLPSSKGGLDNFDNLVPCCRTCNLRKNSITDLEQFRKRLASPVMFTPEQIDYLASLNVDVSPLPGYLFYFETMDEDDA
jgi:hypothetical protein